MRFTVSGEAIERLKLSPELKERVFEGPRVDRGQLAGFTTGELRWAKRELLRIDQIQELDLAEVRPLYFFLAIRRADPRVLPERLFADLADLDFEVVPHPYLGDLAQCKECTEPVRSDVHDVPDEPTY